MVDILLTRALLKAMRSGAQGLNDCHMQPPELIVSKPEQVVSIACQHQKERRAILSKRPDCCSTGTIDRIVSRWRHGRSESQDRGVVSLDGQPPVLSIVAAASPAATPAPSAI
jgi:hypothetical protein